MHLPRELIEKEALKALDNKNKIVTDSFKNTISKLRDELKKSSIYNHRRMLVLSGGTPETQGVLAGYAIQRISKLLRSQGRSELSLLYMYHDEFDSSRIRKEAFRLYMKKFLAKKESGIQRIIDVYEKTDRYLGTTFDMLVLDLNDDFKPNDVGRLIEVVRGGGLIILLVPEWEEWDKKLTIFKQKLLVPGYNEPRHVFLSWVKKKLLESAGIIIFDIKENKPIKKPRRRHTLTNIPVPEDTDKKETYNTIFPKEVYETTLTKDQYNVVFLMEKLVQRPKKGRKTAIIVTSDRGRGKSCSLGIGLIGLAHALKKYKNRVRILVTAPSPTNVQSLFQLAIRTAEKLGHQIKEIRKEGNIIELKGPYYSIEYWEPIVIPKLRGDIVAVDEASGIHVPQLLRIYNSHDRIIFTATIHGYEGAGRGFSIRFLGALKEDKNLELIQYEMHVPIRYGIGDPIEEWLYKTLLLDAEPAKLDEHDIKDIETRNLNYIKIDPYQLFTKENEEKLRQLFGIYVLAHYRNQPDDLGLLADAPHHIIRAIMTTSGKIVASLQIAVEGALDDNTTELLLRGNKIPGNIIPDRILKHVRIREMGNLRGYRIVRIATHPDVQSRGIGSFALKKLVEEAEKEGLDWVGSGFGVNYPLLKFWVKNNFLPIHMSPDRNPVSGEYTIIVLRPISKIAKEIFEISKRMFLKKVLKSLRDTYRDLEHDVALLIVKSLASPSLSTTINLDPISKDRLWIYAYGPMTYEALSDVMYDIALYYFLNKNNLPIKLNETKEYILLMKVLQGRSWEEIAKELKEKELKIMLMLKEVAQEFLFKIYGKTYESPIGLSLKDFRTDKK